MSNEGEWGIYTVNLKFTEGKEIFKLKSDEAMKKIIRDKKPDDVFCFNTKSKLYK